jgi:hypothetical protein
METKKVVKVKRDGTEISVDVRRPDQRQRQQADLVYARKYRQMVRPEDGGPGALVRPAIDVLVREQGLWDDKRQAEYEQLRAKLLAGEKRLMGGNFKLKEARALAIDMRRWRREMASLLAERNRLDINSADAHAEQAKFEYLVSACAVRSDTGKPYFASLEDYQARADDEDAVAIASACSSLFYGIDQDWRKELPENKWLLKYKFCREDLVLIDERGRPISEDGRLIDDKGRLVNDKGELVDEDGNLLTEDGEYKVEAKPFLDDEGNPVSPPV